MDMDTTKNVLNDMVRDMEQQMADAPKVGGEPMTLPSAPVLRDRIAACKFSLLCLEE